MAAGGDAGEDGQEQGGATSRACAMAAGAVGLLERSPRAYRWLLHSRLNRRLRWRLRRKVNVGHKSESNGSLVFAVSASTQLACAPVFSNRCRLNPCQLAVEKMSFVNRAKGCWARNDNAVQTESLLRLTTSATCT